MLWFNFLMGTFTPPPWIKVATNNYAKGDASHESTQYTVGTHISPDDGPGKFHIAYTGESKEADDVAETKTTSNSAQFVTGMGLSI